MIALRQTQIDARIPWQCGECPQEVKTDMGCDRGTLAPEPLRFVFGGRRGKKTHTNELSFERCPKAILRDSPPDALAWTDYAIRMSLAKEQGSINITDIPPGELALIHIADDIRYQRDIELFYEGDSGE